MDVIKQPATIKGCKWIGFLHMCWKVQQYKVCLSGCIRPLWAMVHVNAKGLLYHFKGSLLIIKCDFKSWPCICIYVCVNEETPSQMRLLITAKQRGFTLTFRSSV